MNQSYKREREDFEMGNLFKKKLKKKNTIPEHIFKKNKKSTLIRIIRKNKNPQEGGREYSQFFFFFFFVRKINID